MTEQQLQKGRELAASIVSIKDELKATTYLVGFIRPYN